MGVRVATRLVGALWVCLGAAGCGEPFAATTGAGGMTTTSSGSGAMASTGSTTSSTGAMPDGGTECQNGLPSPCAHGYYCFSPTCTTGHCVKAPNFAADPLGADPLCSCDGPTYWNSTVANEQTAAVKLAGACGTAGHSCGGMAGKCSGNRTFCNFELATPAGCPPVPQMEGHCWVLPNDCGGAPGAGHECSDPTNCTPICSLIEAEKPWFRLPPACP